jgi:phospholipid-translocating ATPase
LDGETDWKLRLPVQLSQQGIRDERLRDIVNFDKATIHCEHPSKHIYEFAGLFQNHGQKESIRLDNTMWADTVLASQGFIIGIVVFTGPQTRSNMNKKQAHTKTCLLD